MLGTVPDSPQYLSVLAAQTKATTILTAVTMRYARVILRNCDFTKVRNRLEWRAVDGTVAVAVAAGDLFDIVVTEPAAPVASAKPAPVAVAVESDPIKALAPSMPTRYLRDFFAEKDIADVEWTLTSSDGTAHHIGSVIVVEHIAGVGRDEALEIEGVLRRIDFANASVINFLRHLAGALVR